VYFSYCSIAFCQIKVIMMMMVEPWECMTKVSYDGSVVQSSL